MKEQMELFFGKNENDVNIPYKSYFGFENKINVKPFDGETGATVLPKWRKYNDISLDGRAEIRDHSDVAYIMRSLESKGVELAFAVHVNDKKEAMVQLLSVGAKSGAIVDVSLILAGTKAHDSKQVYLVHNHPSGNLTPSSEDMKLTERIANALEHLDIEVSHVILNTYKKEYTYIAENAWMSFPRENAIEKAKAYTTHIYDEMNILREPIFDKISSSKDVAELVQQYRFSALPKHGILVMAQNNSVIGNFLVEDFSLKTVTDLIANIPTAKSVVAYGNTSQRAQMNHLKEKLERVDYRLLDYIQVNSDASGIQGAYKSYADESILRETQEKYGTNELKVERAKKVDMPWQSNEKDAGAQNEFKGVSR